MTSLDSRLNPHAPVVLSLFRIVFGLLFAAHGSSILFGWPIDYGGIPPVGAFPDWWAGLLEFVTGLLVMVGLFTRIAAFVASGVMAYAYFTVHQPLALWPIDPVQMGEPAVLYCFGFLLLVFTDGGTWALDARRRGVGVAASHNRTVAGSPRRRFVDRFRR